MTGEIVSVELTGHLTKDAKYKVVFAVDESDPRDGFPFEPTEYTLEVSPKSREWTDWSTHLEPGLVLSNLKPLSWKDGHIDPETKPSLAKRNTPELGDEKQSMLLP